ncbi:MAG TPA: molecular chaperone HtpG [Polyangiaceae bacterium]|jgi:molecular chaperone HtpG|nr:MAG: Chaperone protein HtpG [Deltaproteobacteria bacterium ADurb.Bin207]HNS98955.1 molecular chaperone HtpG [Polyangiaceae bacterium]HNZ22304.1 molecular chaperone HtpG [Polyangiaceae bacterium]HOD20838.1 molecular chaperone HtpG [Polyangiaceae bacterium]HOE51233.1 molecular chaperone HtpG [Polyangiaceae bacterium]
MTDTEAKEKDAAQELPFQAETKQVLHLMVHSLYTNKEVFLRELIANASDALDKVRFLAVTDHAMAERVGPPEIIIQVDRESKTITVEDNGIGMTRQEAIDNLGTIAHSGTVEFLKKLQTDKDETRANLIGQFGVGFYSAFIVADRVDVESRSARDPDAEPVLWRSSGEGSFFITKGERDRPGTKVTVHIKGDENDDLLSDWRIEALIKKYTDFVSHPIKLGEKAVNQTTALWMRPRSEIKQEQYDEFYAHVHGAMEPGTPLERIHFSADAPIQYNVLLFIPSKAPVDLLMDTKKKGIRLYAKRMFVMDGCERLAPPYLQFLRGVVDSEDLSLNVSREILQDDRKLDVIKKAITKQTLKALQTMAEEQPEKYQNFWKEFGRLLRLGVSSDPANQESIGKLLRYPSTATTDEELTSLDAYIGRMKEGQKAIYYLTGPSLKALRSSPHLEVFRRKGVEVLLMHEAVDEWVVGGLFTYDKKNFESIAHGTVDLSDLPNVDGQQDDQSEPSLDAQMQACVKRIEEVLGDRVKQVRTSSRLTDSASCLVSDEGDVSPQMERVMRMLDREVESPKRILELNPKHELVKNLALMVAAEPESEDVITFSELLLDQAMLAEGVVPDPSGLLARMQRVATAASQRTRQSR